MAKKTNTSHYLDNKAFFEALKEYQQQCIDAEARGEDAPGVSDFIGECFQKIATRLSLRPNFKSYSYRDEMISDGIENCLLYCRNFDPKKTENPFSYFTQIIFFAFLRRIEREHRQQYVKYKVAERSHVFREDFHGSQQQQKSSSVDQPYLEYQNIQDFVKRFEARQEKKRKRKTDDEDVDLTSVFTSDEDE